MFYLLMACSVEARLLRVNKPIVYSLIHYVDFLDCYEILCFYDARLAT